MSATQTNYLPAQWANAQTIRAGTGQEFVKLAFQTPTGLLRISLDESNTRVLERILADATPMARVSASSAGGAKKKGGNARTAANNRLVATQR